nr:MAG TPA: hypothetical protein [Caudoviricetes sp.]
MPYRVRFTVRIFFRLVINRRKRERINTVFVYV